jgi:hypothetical protein
MALSGSYDFSLTARQLIEQTLRKLNVLGVAQSLDADEAEAARVELNLVLKGWPRSCVHLWKKTEGTVTLTNATASYDLSATLNPLRILSARYRDSSARDLPLRLFTRERYFDMPIKTNAGTPTQYYFDPQRGAPTLYLWPVLATVTTETVRVTYQKRMDDIDDLANDIDIQQEHLDVLLYALAERLLDDYGIEGEVAKRIIARAAALKREALDFEREDNVEFEMAR